MKNEESFGMKKTQTYMEYKTNNNIIPPFGGTKGGSKGGLTFKIRTYGRTELAQLYCPTVCSQQAYRKLMSWLSINPNLKKLCGLKQRCFTPAQVQLIVSEIGEP